MPTALELYNVIEADADGLGFKEANGDWKSDLEIVALFASSPYTVSRTEVEKADVIGAVLFDDYNGLVADEQEWIRWITAGSGVMKISDDVKTKLTNTASDGGIWLNADTDSPAAILALIEFQGTYAESLWGEGTVISAGEVGRASNQG